MLVVSKKISLLFLFASIIACTPEDTGKFQLDTTNQSQTSPEMLIADSFIFPVQGKGIRNIVENTTDPRKDGWYVTNDYGTWCDNCNGLHGYHPGEDWNLICPNGGKTCDLGVPVYAVADGTVTYAQRYVSEEILKQDPGKDIGMAVVIEHRLSTAEDLSRYILLDTTFPATEKSVRQTIESGYLHLENLQVSAGQTVKRGDLIGHIGLPESPHLHFEIRWKVGNKLFPDYKASHQILTDRGLLVPTTFINAHVGTPFTFTPKDGKNPAVCKNEPKFDSTNGGIVCDIADSVPLAATIWGTIQFDQLKKDACFVASFSKDGVYQYSSSSFCVKATPTTIREHQIFWVRNSFGAGGVWTITYSVGENDYNLKVIGKSSLTVVNTTSILPPPPPRPIDQSLYVFTNVKLTCDRPLSREIWDDYRCDGFRTPIPLGSELYGLVKLHYLIPNLRFRFYHELYQGSTLIRTLTDDKWQSSGWFGLGEVYTFPVSSPETTGLALTTGTWTLRSFITIDGKSTNWITDQQVVVF